MAAEHAIEALSEERFAVFIRGTADVAWGGDPGVRGQCFLWQRGCQRLLALLHLVLSPLQPIPGAGCGAGDGLGVRCLAEPQGTIVVVQVQRKSAYGAPSWQRGPVGLQYLYAPPMAVPQTVPSSAPTQTATLQAPQAG